MSPCFCFGLLRNVLLLNLFVVSDSFDVFIMAGWNYASWEDKVDNQKILNFGKIEIIGKAGAIGKIR